MRLHLANICSLLVLTAACAALSTQHAPVGTQAMIDAAHNNPACQVIASHWPEIVRQTESNMRAKDVASFRDGLAQLRTRLDAQPVSECPEWADSVAIQRATVTEFADLYSITHSADHGAADPTRYGEHSVTELVALYAQMHGDACVEATGHMTAAWAAWRAQDPNAPVDTRQQRYMTNVERDDYLVRPDGSLGPPAKAADFLALVNTPVLPSLSPVFLSLQGQGPTQAPAAEAYVTAALRFAERNAVGRVTFVNAAGGQVPNFAAQVSGVARAISVNADYVEFNGWRDGYLVTPQQAATFAATLADHFGNDAAHGQPALLVVNCNAGMDRSGTVNVLVQLIMQTRRDLAAGMSAQDAGARGFAQIPSIVHSIKTARPRAISSPSRFLFLYEAYAAFLDSLKP